MKNAERLVRLLILCVPLWGAFASGAHVESGHAKVTPHPRGFTIRTPRLSATFEDGMIVALCNLKTGEVHADRKLDDHAVPRGMGHLTGDTEAAVKLHMPWGTRSMNQHIKLGGTYPTLHRPHPGSRCKADAIAGGMRATWTGLSNGATVFPNETLTVEARVDPATGVLLFRATARSDTQGVYGVQVPLVNLHPEHAFYVPSFGGVMYTRDVKPALTTLGGKPFWEAPVVGVEGTQGSIALWKQDAKFHPDFLFFNWSGRSFSLAIEHLNLMPFEPHTRTESVAWHLDVFDGGWVDAMTPYKQWYARTFAPELKARAAVTWADKVRVIIDHFEHSSKNYRTVAATFDPQTVLFHDWNARAPRFDGDLPDWTPRAGYVERVKTLQKYGFKTMAYVNTYCVNYNCPVFKRDKIATFGLPRRIRGFWKYLREPLTFETAKDGQLMYLDPLSARWRAYHTDLMIWWNRTTGTDANYEDTAGACGDFGNGVVDGQFGGQGTVEQFRDLLRRNPSVPMASEYAPAELAFAVRWPLRYQQVWGNEKTRVFWMQHQRPVSAYIHGPLHYAWIPMIRAESDFSRHVVVACSDALGGMAQFAAFPATLQADKGVVLHMKWRAQVFSRRQLVPHFTRNRHPRHLACMYRDADGGIYRYIATGNVQTMAGPNGKPLYQRVTGVNRLKTDLVLPGWPAYGQGEVIGLSPDLRYCLMPGSPDRMGVQVVALPPGVKITRFYETRHSAVLVLGRVDDHAPKQGQVELRLDRRVRQVLLNDRLVKRPVSPGGKQPDVSVTYKTPFPANLLLVKGSVNRPKHDEHFARDWETRHYVTAAGLDRGTAYTRDLTAAFRVPDRKQPVPFAYLGVGSGAEVTFDHLVRVPAKTSSLVLYLVHRQSKYGDGAIGRLYINGKQVRAYDFGPRPNPAWKKGMPRSQKTIWKPGHYHRWRVPLGRMAGQPVLITLASDPKASDNADSLWWSRPMWVSDPDQKPSYVKLTKDDATERRAGGPPKPSAAAENAAVAAAEAWLKSVDAGHYAASWDHAAEHFRNAVPKSKWESQMRALRKPLGRMLLRKLKMKKFLTALPGAPDGQYVVIQFATSFQDKKSAVETVTPMRDKDGTWRVSGYYIK